MQLTGLTAAAFTPLNNDATLDIDRIPGLVEHLLRDGVSALYVLGSTGEGISLTIHERQQTATAFVKAAANCPRLLESSFLIRASMRSRRALTPRSTTFYAALMKCSSAHG